MREHENTRCPARLNVGHDGFVESPDLYGLRTDLLMQNICLICQKEALNLDEIAQTLDVPAPYLEDRLEKLFYIGYLDETKDQRYRTTFFIRDHLFAMAEAGLRLELLEPVVRFYYDTVKNVLPKIRALGIMGGAHSDDELLWNIMPLFISLVDVRMARTAAEKLKLVCQPPLRRDGSCHWIYADSGIIPPLARCSEEIYDLLRLSGGMVKRRSSGAEPGDITALQYDFPLLCGPREFGQKELQQLRRLRQLIKNHEIPDKYDRAVIAALSEKGYVCMKDKTPAILIPFLSYEQMEQLRVILEQSARNFFDETAVLNAYMAFSRRIAAHIPDYVDPRERRHLQNRFNPECRILFLLHKKGLLPDPDAEQKKRLCTIVWEP